MLAVRDWRATSAVLSPVQPFPTAAATSIHRGVYTGRDTQMKKLELLVFEINSESFEPANTSLNVKIAQVTPETETETEKETETETDRQIVRQSDRQTER